MSACADSVVGAASIGKEGGDGCRWSLSVIFSFSFGSVFRTAWTGAGWEIFIPVISGMGVCKFIRWFFGSVLGGGMTGCVVVGSIAVVGLSGDGALGDAYLVSRW